MRRFLQCNTPNWETPTSMSPKVCIGCKMSQIALDVTLTPEEVEYLEELYVPHPLTSVVRPSVEAKK